MKVVGLCGPQKLRWLAPWVIFWSRIAQSEPKGTPLRHCGGSNLKDKGAVPLRYLELRGDSLRPRVLGPERFGSPRKAGNIGVKVVPQCFVDTFLVLLDGFKEKSKRKTQTLLCWTGKLKEDIQFWVFHVLI